MSPLLAVDSHNRSTYNNSLLFVFLEKPDEESYLRYQGMTWFLAKFTLLLFR